MRLGRAFFLLFGAVTIFAISGRSAKRVPVVDLEQWGYVGALQTTYLYTQAVKSSALYGDVERAIVLYNKVLELDSLHSPSYYELATIYVPIDVKKALEYSQHAQRLDTTNVWYLSQLGQLLLMNQEYEKAFPVFSKLVTIAPNNPQNYRILAALHHQNKEPFSAISVLEEAETRLGRVEELSGFKRELLLEVKLYDKALTESEAILRDFPFEESNYVIMAQLYAATKKDSLAGVTFEQGLEFNPNSVELLTAASDFYREKSDNQRLFDVTKKMFTLSEIPVEEKIKMFNSLKSNNDFYRANYFNIHDLVATLYMLYPKDERVFDLQVDHLLATGNIDQGVKLLKSRLEEPKPELKHFYQVIDAELYLDHSDSVAKYSEMALRAFPKNAELYMRNGYTLSRMKKDEQAILSYQNALKYSASDSLKSDVYLLLGDYYYKNTDLPKTFSYYDKALKLNPDNAGALNNYAYYLTVSTDDKKKLEKALAMSERACQLIPSYATFLDTQAWALYKLGRFAEAKKIMQLAISLDSRGSAELFIHYGDILYELKEYFMASVYWKKSLESGHNAEDINLRMEKIKGK